MQIAINNSNCCQNILVAAHNVADNKVLDSKVLARSNEALEDMGHSMDRDRSSSLIKKELIMPQIRSLKIFSYKILLFIFLS